MQVLTSQRGDTIADTIRRMQQQRSLDRLREIGLRNSQREATRQYQNAARGGAPASGVWNEREYLDKLNDEGEETRLGAEMQGKPFAVEQVPFMERRMPGALDSPRSDPRRDNPMALGAPQQQAGGRVAGGGRGTTIALPAGDTGGDMGPEGAARETWAMEQLARKWAARDKMLQGPDYHRLQKRLDDEQALGLDTRRASEMGDIALKQLRQKALMEAELEDDPRIARAQGFEDAREARRTRDRWQIPRAIDAAAKRDVAATTAQGKIGAEDIEGRRNVEREAVRGLGNVWQTGVETGDPRAQAAGSALLEHADPTLRRDVESNADYLLQQYPGATPEGIMSEVLGENSPFDLSRLTETELAMLLQVLRQKQSGAR